MAVYSFLKHVYDDHVIDTYRRGLQQLNVSLHFKGLGCLTSILSTCCIVNCMCTILNSIIWIGKLINFILTLNHLQPKKAWLGARKENYYNSKMNTRLLVNLSHICTL